MDIWEEFYGDDFKEVQCHAHERILLVPDLVLILIICVAKGQTRAHHFDALYAFVMRLTVYALLFNLPSPDTVVSAHTYECIHACKVVPLLQSKKTSDSAVILQSHHPGTFNSTVVVASGKYDMDFPPGEDPDEY